MNFLNIPIQKISKRVDNYKLNKFDFGTKQKLLYSIRKYGLLMPLIVNEVNNEYKVIDGMIRFELLKKLDYKEIWCNVVRCKEEEEFLLYLIVHSKTRTDYFNIAKKVSQSPLQLDDFAKYTELSKNEVDEFSKMFNFNWDVFSHYEDFKNNISNYKDYLEQKENMLGIFEIE